MKIPILIEPISDNRFRVTGGGPFPECVEADTLDEAVARMRQLIGDRLARGARVTEIDVSLDSNPWLTGASMLENDPLFDSWQQAIAEYRRKANESTDSV